MPRQPANRQPSQRAPAEVRREVADRVLDESIHQYFMNDSPDKEVQAELASAQVAVNKLWADAELPKFIQFGKDDKGSHSHAVNGPAFKAAWGNPPLLIETFKLMEPVWDMLEARKDTPAIDADVASERVQEEGARSRSSKKPSPKVPTTKKKKKKYRGVNGLEIEDEMLTNAQEDGLER